MNNNQCVNYSLEFLLSTWYLAVKDGENYILQWERKQKFSMMHAIPVTSVKLWIYY